MELGSSGGVLQACRNGALEARCKHVDVEVEIYRVLELWRYAAGAQTWRQEFGSSGGALQVSRRGALAARGRRAGVETWRSGG